MSRMVSPNEMLEAAKQHMLDGCEPQTTDDWFLVMNFLALNTHRDTAESACLLLRTLYDMPITDEEVKHIVQFQNERR